MAYFHIFLFSFEDEMLDEIQFLGNVLFAKNIEADNLFKDYLSTLKKMRNKSHTEVAAA